MKKTTGFLVLIILFVINIFCCKKIISIYKNNISDQYGVNYKLFKYIDRIQSDFKVFPVAYSEKNDFVYYVDSWGGKRDYGGNRKHEGTDIMGGINKRGYYPLVSCCDGTVEKMGWLELGGYRIGIRSENNVYFYYAHLYKYSEGIYEGAKVRKGDLIGYMGDSGYSKKEGTVGNFAVHLHFGIYIDTPEFGEVPVNPYYFLKKIERNKIIYDY